MEGPLRSLQGYNMAGGVEVKGRLPTLCYSGAEIQILCRLDRGSAAGLHSQSAAIALSWVKGTAALDGRVPVLPGAYG